MNYPLPKQKLPTVKIANSFPGTAFIRFCLAGALLICSTFTIYAQTADTGKLVIPILRDSTKNSTAEFLSLKDCINYALIHQPGLNQSLINIDIAKTTNAITLSSWLPQVNATGEAIHYIQQSAYGAAVVGGNTTTTTTTGTGTGTIGTGTTGTTGTGTTGTGTTSTGTGTGGTSERNSAGNSFVPELSVSQAIFSPSLFYAAKSAPLLVQQAQQVTDSTKIYLVSAVSKSYYNVLLTLEQINVLKEDTARLGKNLRDAYHQYVGGIVDETDYEEAQISLNNSNASLKQANENIVPLYASLKQLMGYPPEKQFNVSFDTLRMKEDINIDTTQQLQYQKRIEFQQLKTQMDIQSEVINYYKVAFLPTVSAFFNYDLAYENNKLNDIFDTSYPSSLVGISISIPIFTGFSRLHNLHKAQLQEQLLDWQQVDLKSQIYTQYTTALASYKGNYYNLQMLQKNVALAKRTYFVVDLQYKQGIVAYLNVITAESNLISSEISYINALFQVLSNKIDLEKSMGDITY
jgi:multidrug efflux system outer membrane protein